MCPLFHLQFAYVNNLIKWSAVNNSIPNIRWQYTFSAPFTWTVRPPNSSFNLAFLRSAVLRSLYRIASTGFQFRVRRAFASDSNISLSIDVAFIPDPSFNKPLAIFLGPTVTSYG